MPTDRGDENWRPKLSVIDDPIADDEWEFEGPAGEEHKMRVIVGRPKALPGKDWYTPISIEGFTPGIRAIYGVGPADSLMNAMTLARTAFNHIHRLAPEGKDELVSTMRWIESWYGRQCNGDWEHQRGVKIETLDNPGWMLKVDLGGTDLADFANPDRVLESFGTTSDGHPVEAQWLRSEIRRQQYVIAGSPDRLMDLFSAFKAWATKAVPPAAVA